MRADLHQVWERLRDAIEGRFGRVKTNRFGNPPRSWWERDCLDLPECIQPSNGIGMAMGEQHSVDSVEVGLCLVEDVVKSRWRTAWLGSELGCSWC
jgi:hypothetical protein